MILIEGVWHKTFDENGEEVFTKVQYEELFATNYYDFFRILDSQYGIKLEENWDVKSKKDKPYVIADYCKKFSPNYYTLGQVYDALLNKCRNQWNRSEYDFIKEYDDYVLQMINHPLLEKYRREYHPKQQPKSIMKNNTERAILYHFMRDFGRFPNEQEEAEYSRNANLEEMLAELERTTKKVKGAEK
jgi:hypothetical protein